MKSSRSLLSFIILALTMVGLVFVAAQAGLYATQQGNLEGTLAPESTADYSPWDVLRFGRVDPRLSTLVSEERGTQISQLATNDPEAFSLLLPPTSNPTRLARLTATAGVIPNAQITLTDEGTLLGGTQVAQAATATAEAETPILTATEDTGTPTVTLTPTTSLTPTGTITPTLTETITPTLTETHTPTATLTLTLPPLVTPTNSPTPTETPIPAPVADFDANPTSGFVPLTVAFDNDSTGDITGYEWNFGDGNNSTGTNPSHTFNSAGTYTVRLTASGPGGSDTFTRTITVNGPTADLAISAAFSAGTIFVGEQSTLTLNVNNTGPFDAPNTTVTTTLPGGVTFVSASAGCSAGGATVTCSLGTLANSGSASLTITVQGASAGAASLGASVSSSIGDSNNGNNSAAATLNVQPLTADLSLTAGIAPGTIFIGEQSTLTLNVNNAGPFDAPNTTVTTSLPGGVTFVSASAGCSEAGGTVTCNLGTLANGGSNTVTITVQGASAGGATLSASVASALVESNNGNNSASALLTVDTPFADLQVTLSTTAPSIRVGRAVSLNATVSNTGVLPAVGTTLTIPLPSIVSFQGASAGCTEAGGTVTCDLGTLAVGGNASISVDLRGASVGSATITASTATTTTEFATGDNSASAPLEVTEPLADLSLTKEINNATRDIGQSTYYTLRVRNAGPDSANNVQIIDTLPTGVTFISADGVCAHSAGTVTCDGGTLNNNQNYTVRVFVEATTNGVYTTSATVTWDPPTLDPNPGDTTASATLTIGSAAGISADVEIDQSTVDNNVRLRTTFNYRFRIFNGGLEPATNTTVTVTLPASVSTTSIPGVCTQALQVVTCDIGTLANAERTPLYGITLQADTAGSFAVDVAVSATEPDPDPSNNSVSTPFTIFDPGAADIALAKSVDTAAPIFVGDTVQFTVSATNTGPDSATNLRVTDVLPASLTFVGATPSQGTYDNTNGRWTIGTLGASSTATLTLTATVTTTNGFAPITNTANRGGLNEDDLNPANDSASASFTVSAQADLSAAASFAPGTVTVGDGVSLNVTVTNNGPDTAVGAAFSVVIPAELTIASLPGGCSDGGGTVTCTLGDLNNGDAPSRSIGLTAVGAGNPSVTANATTTSNDPNGGNNAASASLTINAPPAADLSAAASFTPGTVTVGDGVSLDVTVTNNGPDTAVGAAFSVAIPAELTVASLPGGCSEGGGTVTCTLGDLNNGDAPSRSIGLTAVGAGNPSVTANATTTTNDPNGGNNAASASLTINAPSAADLSAAASFTPGTVTVGDGVSLDVTITNNGPDTAVGATFSVVIPAELDIASLPGGCSEGGGTVTCTLGDLNNGDAPSRSIGLTTVGAGNPSVTANATTTTNDPNGGNNGGVATVTITP